jgi:hypothetical protein
MCCSCFGLNLEERFILLIVFVSVVTYRAVFTHGPKGPGPRTANLQGRHIKKIEIEEWYAGKKKAVHEREI